MKTSTTLDKSYEPWNPFVDVSFGNPDRYRQAEEGEQSMTVKGTVRMALILLCVAVASGIFGWSELGTESTTIGAVIVLVGFFAAIAAAFKPKVVAPAAVLFAVAWGVAVGMYGAHGPTDFAQATVTSAVVVMVMVVLYGGGLLRSTSSVVKVIAGVAGGVGCAYAVGFAAKAFGVDLTFLGQTDLVGAAGSVLAAGLAASNLLSVFSAIELSVEKSLTKDAQWAGAAGVLFTASTAHLETYRLVVNLIVRLILKVRAALVP